MPSMTTVLPPSKMRKCGHDKAYHERCIECQLAWDREGLKIAQQNVERFSARIAKLESELNGDRKTAS